MLNEVIKLMRKADREILSIYDFVDAEVDYKKDNSPLTRADRVSNDILTEGLKVITPDILIISEETASASYQERKNWEKFWLVDPLDGTKEFIKKNGEFTVNVALIEKGVPVMGVVAIPAQNKIYYGVKGEGAFRIDGEELDSIRIEAKRSTDRGEKMIAAVSRSHLAEETTLLIDMLKAETVSSGSALKFALVAEGKADLYPRLGPTWEWDTGAGHAVAEAAGAIVCDLDGEPLRYNKEILKHSGFLVCLPEIKDKLIKAISHCLPDQHIP